MGNHFDDKQNLSKKLSNTFRPYNERTEAKLTG